MGFTRIQTTPKCIEMITFIPLKDSGLIIKTPFRRREDVETNEDKEVAFVRTQLQEIEIIRFMDLRKGTLAVKAIFSPKWDVEVKAAEGVHQIRNQNRSERVVKAVKPPVLSMIRMQAVEGIHQNQNQNRSQRVVKEVGAGVAISRSNIKLQETFRRAISFQMLRITLSSCKDNRTNEREEEEILMKIRCIQHPRGSLSAAQPRPPVLSMIRMQGSSDKVNPANADRETAIGHETDVVTEMLVKLG